MTAIYDCGATMRLSEFIRQHANDILALWDEFAATVPHAGKKLDRRTLRDHAGEILLTIAADLEQPQSDAEQIAKSRGEASGDGMDTAAETHADGRIVAGFAIDAMLTEYRALRASVLRLWAASKSDETHADELDQLTRFNEAIDQAICESVARYTEQVRFFTNLSMGMLGHDIRNPLSTIAMSAELLARSERTAQSAVASIARSARRIDSIVGLLIDFSQVQSQGGMPISPQFSSLRKVFEGVIADSLVIHPSAECNLVAQGNPQGVWDEVRLAQVLSNLLENAIAYGAQDRPITITLLDEGQGICFSVHNHGEVIPEANLDRIFEPRSRGSLQDQTKAPNGMGLGLYISREIMRAHDGTLSVRSNEAEGTTFVARLPKQQSVMQKSPP